MTDAVGMASSGEVLRKEDGGDWIERTPLPLSDLLAQPNSRLGRIYAHWRSLRESLQKIPDRRFVDPVTFHRLRIVGSLHIIDVSPQRPQDFKFKVHGTVVTQLRQVDLTGIRLADLPNQLHARSLGEDYQRAKTSGEPLFQNVRASYDFSSRDYRRLILPVSASGQGVDTLVVGVQSPETEDILRKTV